jgi:hypothetical protein
LGDTYPDDREQISGLEFHVPDRFAVRSFIGEGRV